MVTDLLLRRSIATRRSTSGFFGDIRSDEKWALQFLGIGLRWPDWSSAMKLAPDRFEGRERRPSTYAGTYIQITECH